MSAAGTFDTADRVMINASRFRAAHEEGWKQLDALLARIERRSVRSLSDDELLSLPLLYRSTLSSLSVARETSLDRGLITYLEQLSVRAYFQIYGVPVTACRQLILFFRQAWPKAVQSLWRETLVCLVLTVAAAIVAYLLVRADPSWFFGIIPEALSSGRDPSATADFLQSTLYQRHDDMLLFFGTYLFTHNSQIAIFAFALGFAFALPTVLLIIYNGLMLGAMVAVFASKGLGLNFAAWLAIHGTTEMFAICLAGAAGIRIGTVMAFPGRDLRTDALIRVGRPAAVAMAGAVIMLAIAALLEGVGRQTILMDGNRILVGTTMLIGWVTYFYLPRRPSWR